MTREEKDPHIVELGHRLTEAGWRQRAGLVYSKDLGDDVTAYLGLDLGTRVHGPVTMSINPIIGVGSPSVEKRVARYTGLAKQSNGSVVVESLHALAARDSLWYVQRDEDPTDCPELADIMRAVENEGEQYLTERSTRKAIVEAIRAGEGDEDVTDVRLPVLLDELGETAAARTAAQNLLDDDEDDEFVADFVDNFLADLDKEKH